MNRSRRHFLRGTGVAMALPWMESVARANGRPRSLRLEEPPLRAAFLFMPNGVWPKHWQQPTESDPLKDKASGETDDWRLTEHTLPLAKVKGQISLVEGLWNKQATGRNGHWPKIPAYLSGGFVVRTSGRDIDVEHRSLDQELADAVGDRTPLPSLQLGVDEAYQGVDNIGGGFARIYGSHISWRNRHTPVPNEIVPQLAFDRLFRTGPATPVVSGYSAKLPEVRKSLAGDDTSLLDLVREDARSLSRRVCAADKAKLDEYQDSVRSIERRLEAALKPQKRWVNGGDHPGGRFDLSRPGPGIPEEHVEHVRLMMDILVLAFWTDTTRVCTFMMGNAQTGRNFGFIDGVKGSFHGLSHHREEERERKMYISIVDWHVVQLTYLLEKMSELKETPETSLLDNSMVLWGSTLSDGNKHDEHNLPLILAGRGKGALSPGRRIKCERDTPLCNLHLSLLQKFGVERDRFGDSTGVIENL